MNSPLDVEMGGRLTVIVQSTLASSVQERPNRKPDVAGHEIVPSSGQSARYVSQEWLKREDVPVH